MCLNGGTCYFNNCVTHCECVEGFGGYMCQNWTTTKQSSFTSRTINKMDSTNPGATSKMNSTATCAVVNRKQNNCPGHFPCKHGVCIHKEYHSTRIPLAGKAYHIYCECDPGWIKSQDGHYCDTCCDLDCGENGSCVVYNGIKHCQCKLGYTGITCDQLDYNMPGNILAKIAIIHISW